MAMGTADCRRGVVLYVQATLPDGECVNVQWKAHSIGTRPQTDPESLRWEVRRFAPSLGFAETSKRKLWTVIAENWSKWRSFILMCGFKMEEHCGRSKHALVKQVAEVSAEELAMAEQEYWVSTEALLCMLLHLPSHRRSLSERVRCTLVAKAFFVATLPPGSLGDLCHWSVAAGAKAACQRFADSDNVCECLQKCIGDPSLPDASTMPPQHFVHMKAMKLAQAFPCPAAVVALKMLLERLAALIVANHMSWGDHEWHRGQHAIVQGFAKKRRVDYHVKQYVVVESVQSGQLPSSSLAARGLAGVAPNSAVKWRGVEMSAYRAACLLSFCKDMSISLAVDASRLGRPAREVLAGFVACEGKQMVVALPPQVCLCPVGRMCLCASIPQRGQNTGFISGASHRQQLVGQASC